MARLPATPTRPSRGPWLAIGLCCPDGSSLTTASSAPRDSLPATYEFAAEAAAPKEIGLGWESRGSPIYSAGLCSRRRLPYPGGPRRVRTTVASSSVLAFTSDLRVRRPHWSFRGCRVHSELTSLHITARELASPPFEDVYVRAFVAGSPRTSVKYNYVGKQSISHGRTLTGKSNLVKMGCSNWFRTPRTA